MTAHFGVPMLRVLQTNSFFSFRQQTTALNFFLINMSSHSVQNTDHKTQDMDLNVGVACPYSALKLKFRSYFI